MSGDTPLANLTSEGEGPQNTQTPAIPPSAATAPSGPTAAAAPSPQANRAVGVLKAVSAGQIPGVVIPDDAPKIDSKLTQKDIAGLGVGMYKAKSKGLAMVMFNQKAVPLSTLQALDKAGKLETAFPSITQFLASSGVPGPTDNETADSPISDLNLTGSPTPGNSAAVPVLPKSSFSADAQKQLGLMRANRIAGNVAPSARPLPGQGSVLNGLLQPTV